MMFKASMESLSDRWSKLELKSTEEFLPEFGQYSIIELGDTVVTWGTTHKGRRFQEVWCEHQSYVKWFLDHYSKSTKLDHQKFIFFIQLKIERLELEGRSCTLLSTPCVSKTSPAQTKPATSPAQTKPAVKNDWFDGSVAETDQSWEPVQSERSLEDRVEDLESKLEAVSDVLAGGVKINGGASSTDPSVSMA